MKRYAQYDLENMSVREKEELARTTQDPELLRELANDESKYVRVEVARNSNTPIDVLEMLMKDKESASVRDEAKIQLRERGIGTRGSKKYYSFKKFSNELKRIKEV